MLSPFSLIFSRYLNHQRIIYLHPAPTLTRFKLLLILISRDIGTCAKIISRSKILIRPTLCSFVDLFLANPLDL